MFCCNSEQRTYFKKSVFFFSNRSRALISITLIVITTIPVDNICNIFQILMALRYYASGSFLKVIADTMGVSKASASRALVAVSACLEKMAPDWIVFPTGNSDVNESTI